MPKISIVISDYTYWRLLGSGENISYVIQKALKGYWNENQNQKNNKNTTMVLHSKE